MWILPALMPWHRRAIGRVERANSLLAAVSYNQGLLMYRGDLCVATDIHAVVERERLRARYLTLLSQIADCHYRGNEYSACSEYAWRLLACDPTREDAHRLVMRCYVRQGERAAAIHHYDICVKILRASSMPHWSQPRRSCSSRFGSILAAFNPHFSGTSFRTPAHLSQNSGIPHCCILGCCSD